ncbi:hypothetical protein [Deinococcus wulumuqiensis]|uniref:HK97 family phage prohead protease n=1 Tax=Deinococcus wulumuqiensis TaxID=980427 RepID=A0AAV4K3B5_9DEIO|nr:hypothetical protein [Deinococcus wulumuqiensis]QII20200.1 hypothetical protein G6R31_05015 [Deinococcus wulumuqiensis R12]GGI75252.1 hypothetical protein GCM10010914_06830 [Deinococcus wulumuqiensis]GGP28699.1 hypothetical protein GCM10008021_03500 [Deinococcus wulumuqiensis]
MPQMNRSPCTTSLSRLLLRESVTTEHGMRLTEHLGPDRGNASLREEKRGGETVTLVDVTVATAGRVNRNRRYYSREVWAGAIAAAQDDIAAGKFWGLLEHPKDGWDDWDPLKGRLEAIWVIYEKLWLDGDTVKATGVLIDDHAAGQTMRALLKKKVAVGISSNGTGSGQYLPAKEIPGLTDPVDPEELIAVIQPDFRLLTIDAVSDPSDLSGTARQKETHRPKEGTMHPKLKALLEKFSGLTLEQIKAQHQAEYTAAMVAIAEEVAQGPNTPPTNPAPTPAPAPANSAPSSPPVPAPQVPASQAESTLENTVLGLTTELQRERQEKQVERRTNIAITALEAAQLPRAPKVGELDLDARFREQLINASVTARDDAEAKALVEQMIGERAALMGAAQQRGQRPQESASQRAGGVSLPTGNNSAPSRQLEGHNPVASARGFLNLK